MARACSAPLSLLLSGCLLLSAPTRIDDPQSFVTHVYQKFVDAQANNSSYTPPDDLYTPRLAALFREDERKAKGEVGCLDFDFWIDGQDWKISELAITSKDLGPDRKTIIAKFRNTGTPREIHFDFQRNAGRWLLDDVHSVLTPRWTLSKILKCTL